MVTTHVNLVVSWDGEIDGPALSLYGILRELNCLELTAIVVEPALTSKQLLTSHNALGAEQVLYAMRTKG